MLGFLLCVWLFFSLCIDKLCLFRVKDAMLFVRCMLVCVCVCACVCVCVSLERKYLNSF